MKDKWISIGRVRSVNVPKREIRVAAPSKRMAEIAGAGWVHVRLASGEVVRCKTDKSGRHHDTLILKLSAGVSKDLVGSMRKGANLVIERESSPAEDAWDVADLLDMQVTDADGAAVGKVTDTFETAAHGVMEVELLDGRRVLMPVVPELIAQVDLDGGAISVIDPAPYTAEDED